MSDLNISPIPAFTDNYFWLLERGGRAVVVDPGDAGPVEQALARGGLALEAILVTHHHSDHVGGLAALRARHAVPVYGPAAEAAAIGQLTHTLREGDRIEVLGTGFEAWEVPGHTLGHLAYVAAGPSTGPRTGFVLCGDTLFSAGCGRLFEGTPEQMHRSLSRLAALPPATRVYCTHEYTLSNLAFAVAVEPANPALAAEIGRVRALRAAGAPSLPSSIAHERAINPFLRAAEPAVAAAAGRHAGQALDTPLQVFTALRRWKDGFRPPADWR